MERDGLVWPQADPLFHFQPVARDVSYVRVSPWRARSQLSDVGSIPIARSISLDDSVAFMRLSR